MAILVSTQADIAGHGPNGVLGELARGLGIPGFPGPRSPSDTVSGLERLREDVSGVLSALAGKGQTESFDPSFVGSGKHVVPGGSIEHGKASPIEAASVRQVISQEPKASLIVKKRAFSSLNSLYNPSLMDDAEKWLFRATKRLFLRKCSQLQDYEALTKIKKIVDSGSGPRAALLSLATSFGALLNDADAGGSGTSFFSSSLTMERIARDREGVDRTTWFVDNDLPVLKELGLGHGTFEITLVTSLNTSLGLDGSGTCSISLENPYNLMLITEHDIEMALRDTALSPLIHAVSQAAGLALSTAQTADARLQQARQGRGLGQITFTVDAGAGQGVRAVIDALGFEITEDNLDSVPAGHELDGAEQALFRSVISNLRTYSAAIRRDLIQGGPPTGAQSKQLKQDMEHARKLLRRFYLGRMILQPMDQIHVFIDGGTRRAGEGEEVEKDRNIFTAKGALSAVGSVLGLQDSRQIDEKLLRAAYEASGQHLRFEDFKKLSTYGEGGMHVFAGLVQNVSNAFSDGAYRVSVSAQSNMEWLRISRFNAKPSLDQTEGIVYDPLTPFDFETDAATGLPTGKPKLTATNQKILSGACRQYLSEGPQVGKQVLSENDMLHDFAVKGGSLVPVFDTPTGLKYKWKEGIVTATYDMSTANPLDKSKVNPAQLRRDTGFFASNTVFDNMDVANIISVLVTGQPYNPATFVQSAVNTGAFALDTTLNDTKDYFHTFLDVQQSFNRFHGNWVPYKRITMEREALAHAITLQQRLTKKSQRLRQLRSQFAKLQDDELRNDAANKSGDRVGSQYDTAKKALADKKSLVDARLRKLETEFAEELTQAESIIQSAQWDDTAIRPTIRVAGDNVVFDLVSGTDGESEDLNGDRLLFLTLRRREDVIYNRDKNLFIVSDEYDKDFDIQAFNLQMARNSPEMWRSSWRDVLGLCQQAAEVIDFEFFVNTQGHLELRPPQYNRTPASVLNAMLTFNKTAGIKLFPDFIEKLVLGRGQGLVRDIRTIEWEINKEIAILGKAGERESVIPGIKSFLIEGDPPKKAAGERKPRQETATAELKAFVKQISSVTAQKTSGQQLGIFSARSQVQLQRTLSRSFDTASLGFVGRQSKDLYDQSVDELSKLTGKPKNSFPAYDQARIGAPKNGVSSPASDASAAIGRIAQLVSRRDRLLQMLERTLDQATEVVQVNEGGGTALVTGGQFGLGERQKKSRFYSRIVVDDQQHILGHMSGRRFVIGDETLVRSSFREAPPQFTSIEVQGTDPLVGEPRGNIAGGFPLYVAFGTDFDLWRQYGWRKEKPLEKPFFWSAEQQCAPYAKMLLSRQRRNIVTGTVTLVGNEFYQLGDVVYVTDTQSLYYVSRVSHSFTFEGDFQTTLDLHYGHAPGDYIPSPTDIIGKGLSNKADKQGAFRTRRAGPGTSPSQDQVLGVVRFADKTPASTSDALDHLLGGADAARNFGVLANAASTAKNSLNTQDTLKSPRIILMTYGNGTDSLASVQSFRAEAVARWFENPQKKGETSSISVGAPTTDSRLAKLKIKPDTLIRIETLNQCVPAGQLTTTDRALLKQGVTASPQAQTLDPTLERVVEIRLRQPPPGGWPPSSQ